MNYQKPIVRLVVSEAPEINMVNIKQLAENGTLYLAHLEERRQQFILQNDAEQAALRAELEKLFVNEKSPDQKDPTSE